MRTGNNFSKSARERVCAPERKGRARWVTSGERVERRDEGVHVLQPAMKDWMFAAWTEAGAGMIVSVCACEDERAGWKWGVGSICMGLYGCRSTEGVCSGGDEADYPVGIGRSGADIGVDVSHANGEYDFLLSFGHAIT
jgi:hypothetical protein